MTPNELDVDWQRLKENDQTHKLISKHTKKVKTTLILYKMCAYFLFYIYINNTKQAHIFKVDLFFN